MSVNQLEPGMDFKNWENEYPSEQYDAFTKAVLRTVAVGLNVSYHSLTGDLSQANYSSARVGMLDEREGYKQLQNWVIDTILTRGYGNWLDMALITNKLNLPYSIRDRLQRVRFIGRTWDWVDPKSEAEAAIAEINAGMSSLTEKLAEKGKDIEDVMKTLAEEKELAAKYGVSVTTIAKIGPAPGDEENPYKDNPSQSNLGNGKGRAIPILGYISEGNDGN